MYKQVSKYLIFSGNFGLADHREKLHYMWILLWAAYCSNYCLLLQIKKMVF